jgi:ABC-type lipopolysaccharide export system ATPase subunit
MSTPLLSATGVRKRYGRRVALHDVDLHVSAGELVALVGETRVGATVDRSDPWAITHLGDDDQSGKGLDGGKFPGRR